MSKMGHKSRKRRMHRAGFHLAYVKKSISQTEDKFNWDTGRYERVSVKAMKTVRMWKMSEKESMRRQRITEQRQFEEQIAADRAKQKLPLGRRQIIRKSWPQPV